MIIHVTGSPGVGKTTLGLWIKNNFKEVIVLDIDDIYGNLMAKIEKKNKNTSTKDLIDYIKKNLHDLFQKEIDKIIDNIVKKKHLKLVFVGLNYPDPRMEIRGNEIFVKVFKVELHAEHKYYIDIPIKQLIKQMFTRTLKETIDDIDNVLNDTLKSPTKTFKINLSNWIKDSLEWKKIYTNNESEYVFVDNNKIKIKLTKLLSK